MWRQPDLPQAIDDVIGGQASECPAWVLPEIGPKDREVPISEHHVQAGIAAQVDVGLVLERHSEAIACSVWTEVGNEGSRDLARAAFAEVLVRESK